MSRKYLRKIVLFVLTLLPILLQPTAAATNPNPPKNDAEFKKQLLSIKANPPIVNSDFTLNSTALAVDKKLSFPQQVARQKDNVELLQKINANATSNFNNSRNVDVVKAAVKLRDSILPFAFIYSLSSDRANTLKSTGYLLKNINDPANIKTDPSPGAGPNSTTAQACNAQGQCAEVDPIVALFMIAIDALTKEFKSKHPFGPTNDLVKFIQRPAGGPNSAFVIARSVLIPQNDNGEIARLLRDPVKRPLEIIQNGLEFLNNDNGIVAQALTRPGDVIFGHGWDPRPQDNGDIARAIRDPVQCTIGKLWGACG